MQLCKCEELNVNVINLTTRLNNHQMHRQERVIFCAENFYIKLCLSLPALRSSEFFLIIIIYMYLIIWTTVHLSSYELEFKLNNCVVVHITQILIGPTRNLSRCVRKMKSFKACVMLWQFFAIDRFNQPVSTHVTCITFV